MAKKHTCQRGGPGRAEVFTFVNGRSFSAHSTACSVLNDMTTTFTADSKFDVSKVFIIK